MATLEAQQRAGKMGRVLVRQNVCEEMLALIES
jgi:hypothetical protein